MTSSQRKLRRRQLDAKLAAVREMALPSSPKDGWLSAIREALGMSQAAQGARLGLTRQAVDLMEKAEVEKGITLARLERAAGALDCDLVVLVVPRAGLNSFLRAQARKLAEKRAQKTMKTMALEDQGVSTEFTEGMIEDLIDEIIDKGDPNLWE